MVRRIQGITILSTGRRPNYAFGNAGLTVHSIPYALRSFIYSPMWSMVLLSLLTPLSRKRRAERATRHTSRASGRP